MNKTYNRNSLEFHSSIMLSDSIMRNIHLTKEFVKTTIDEDFSGNNFWDYLKVTIQSDLSDVNHDSDVPEIIWYTSEKKSFTHALRNLMGDIEIPENAEYSVTERNELEGMYIKALKNFKSFFPVTYNCFKEVIAFIIIARRPGYSGGTVSNRIGMIWLAPEKSWSEYEWLENIIHEFIHNILFLDDMVNCVFTDGAVRLSKEDALAMSAIRQVKRGYDKSYHSAFVSYGIVEYYLKLGNHDIAKQFLDPLIICVEDMIKNTNFITLHGKNLLYELAELVLITREKLNSHD